MENNRLKNSLIAAGIAVFAGVLVFGVNAAVGDAPGYNPPGAGVIPTFTALNVDDNIFVGNSVSATADLIAGGNIFALGSLSTNSDLAVDGNIETKNNLNVERNLTVGLDLDVSGDIQTQNNLHVGRNLAVDLDLDVLGSMDVTNDVVVSGRIDGSLLAVGEAVVGGGLGVGGGADVGGDLDVAGDIQLGTGAMFGSVYRVQSFASNTWLHTDSCYSDDILLNCSGYTTFGLKGLYATETLCTVYTMSSPDVVRAYLTCLDPEGIRTGTNP